MIHTNMTVRDRVLRGIAGALVAVGTYFWLWGAWMIVGDLVAGILVTTAAIGFCPLYVALHRSRSSRDFSRRWTIGLSIVGVILVVGAAIGSSMLTRSRFIADYLRMDTAYKQVLFQTGQGNASSAELMRAYEQAFEQFASTYHSYRPPALRADATFDADLEHVRLILPVASQQIASASYADAHITLEGVRPIFQSLLKRNGFSLVTVAMVDFHDAMEEVIAAADQKNAADVLRAVDVADQRLRVVESLRQDEGIRAIRVALDRVRILAQREETAELPQAAAELKQRFISVYLSI